MTATITRSQHLTSVHEPVLTRAKSPARAMAFGLLLMGVAGAIFLGRAIPTPEALEAAADRFPTIGTATNTYPPGHTSGWHVHPGVHSVVVLGGTLTVYDEHCVRTDYAPGQTYLGGSKPHLAGNEGSDPLDVAITFVHRAAAQDHGSALSAPAGCNVR